MRICSRIEKVYEQADVMPISKNGNYVFFSDCHRGIGNWNDNLASNQNLVSAALQYYYEAGYTYFELGDGDELWENRSQAKIIAAHSDIFWMMRNFYQENRLYMLYGNHDMKKKKRNFASRYYATFWNECTRKWEPLFPDLQIRAGLRLQLESGQELFLLHGHQGDLWNDYLYRVTKFMVRYVWKPLEKWSLHDPTRPAANYQNCEHEEKRICAFAKEKNLIVIAGHTHRPVLQKPQNGNYMNDGSMVHPRCITAIELTRGRFSLVKWSVCSRRDGTLFVSREVLTGPERLEDSSIGLANHFERS